MAQDPSEGPAKQAKENRIETRVRETKMDRSNTKRNPDRLHMIFLSAWDGPHFIQLNVLPKVARHVIKAGGRE